MTIHDPDLRLVDAAADASDPTEAGGLLTIDLAAIEANWRMLASTTVPGECAAVVKRDGEVCRVGLSPSPLSACRPSSIARPSLPSGMRSSPSTIGAEVPLSTSTPA